MPVEAWRSCPASCFAGPCPAGGNSYLQGYRGQRSHLWVLLCLHCRPAPVLSWCTGLNINHSPLVEWHFSPGVYTPTVSFRKAKQGIVRERPFLWAWSSAFKGEVRWNSLFDMLRICLYCGGYVYVKFGFCLLKVLWFIELLCIGHIC